MSIPPPPPDPQQQPPYGGGHGYGYPPPPPPGPYPPQQPWTPYPPQRPSLNALAVAALVLGILCLLPGVGLVLGLVALAQIRRRGERGKGMAIAGAALSTVGLVLLTLFFTTGASGEFWDGVKEGVRESSDLDVPKGSCFDIPDGTADGGVAYDVEQVPCATEHEGEVFATVTLPDGDFPGDARVTDIADERCYALTDAYTMDTWAVRDDVDVYYLVPMRESWDFGDREITCFFGHVDTGAMLTGSLRADETTLDEDQVLFLTAEQLLNEAMDAVPEEEYVEDDLPGHQEWAREIEGALGEQIAILDGHTWPSGAEDQVGDLVEDLEEARTAWGEAADATDADTYYIHMDKGFVMTDPERSVPSREALDLETTPPYSYDDEGAPSEGGSTGGGVDV
ncbi:DUF4190 domain-containing protein [Streptomyces sp. NPDC004610]|uniref:DUF4190 domain-containing protein n=1 Tax=unclassified Streptomyces TaxID=2593676 RepID=UPI0033BC766D